MFLFRRGGICHALAEIAPSKGFNLFYKGFTSETVVWYAYEENADHFEWPLLFQLAKVCKEDDPNKKEFQIAYTPCLLPANFSSRKNRQLGFGHLPVHLLFANLIQLREVLESSLQYSRLKTLTNTLTNADLLEWTPAHFCSGQYKAWWKEWKHHL
jgi:hypothetical protein